MHRKTSFLLEDAAAILDQVNFQPLSNKHIVLTGASGLIGHYLLASLALAAQQTSFSVTAVFHHKPPAYLSELVSLAHGSILIGDLADYSFYPSLPRGDYIVHAAGYGQPGRFLMHPTKTLALNTMGTYALLEHTVAGGRLLFISSSEVYSGLKRKRYTEDLIGTTNPLHPRACYIEGKRCGEAFTHTYRARGVQGVSARLSLAYGPGTQAHDARVLNAFIEKALAGNIDLLDQGKAWRTYCYVTDAVELLWKILLTGVQPVYNVGGQSRTTIADLAHLIGTQLQVPVNVSRKNHGLAGAPDDVRLHLGCARSEFGKRQFIPLSVGIARTIAWQKIIYHAA